MVFYGFSLILLYLALTVKILLLIQRRRKKKKNCINFLFSFFSLWRRIQLNTCLNEVILLVL